MSGISSQLSETSIKVIKFSGKKRDWSIWEEKFVARSKCRGYKNILLERQDIKIPKTTEVIDEKTEEGKKKIKIMELNEIGYVDLILSMNTDTLAGQVAFDIVKKTRVPDYEDGNIQVAWKSLKRKYSPKTAPTLASFNKRFYGSTCSKGMDPDVYLTFLENLRSRMAEMNSTITDDQFNMHALNTLPDDYVRQVESLEKRIGDKDNPLTIEDVREELELRFERMNLKVKKKSGRGNEDMDDDEELAMYTELAMYAGGRPRDKCNHCGKFGHKSADCFNKGKQKQQTVAQGDKYHNNKKKKGRKPMLGKCYNCDEVGHPSFLCPKKKKPKGKDSDIANVATEEDDDEEDDYEVCLMCTEIDNWDDDSMESEDSDDEPCPPLITRPLRNLPIDDDDSESDDESDVESDDDMPALLKREDSDDEEEDEEVGESHGTNSFSVVENATCPVRPVIKTESVNEKINPGTCMSTMADTTEGQRAIDAYEIPVPSQMDMFLQNVATRRGISARNAESWVTAVKSKLKDIHVTTVRGTMENIFALNRALQKQTHTQFHHKTLNAMAREGVDIISDKYAHMAMMAKDVDETFKVTATTFIGDSGASTHMGNCDKGMFDVTVISTPVKVGNGLTLTAQKLGKKRVTAIQLDGSTMDLVLEDYKFVPGLWVNLFSITKALDKGWNIGNNKANIYLQKGTTTLRFDRVIPTHKGFVVGVEMIPREKDDTSLATVVMERGTTVEINMLHKTLGHPSEVPIRNNGSLL